MSRTATWSLMHRPSPKRSLTGCRRGCVRGCRAHSARLDTRSCFAHDINARWRVGYAVWASGRSAMGECLSELEIVSLASDEPLERDRSIAESHLKECDKCRERLERARERHLLHPPDSATQLMPSRPASPAPEPMLTLDGYEMMARIRGGGQGVVFKAIQKSTSRLVAVKVLPHEETAS